MKKSLLTLILSMVCIWSSNAQTVEVPKEVQTKQDNRIAEREQSGKMVMYTVMIFFGNDRNEANNIQSKFNEKYKNSEKEYETVIKWEEPYFKLYAGKFQNAIDAQKLISELKEWLPNVILVKKEMDFPKV